MPESLPPPAECANCGARIPRGARACPECGADERTGWRESDTTDYAALDLPESAFDDEASATKTRRDHRRRANRAVNGLAWYWWCAGVVVLVLIALRWLGLL